MNAVGLTKEQAWEGITSETSEGILISRIREGEKICEIVSVNPAISSLSQYSSEELIGHDVVILLPEKSRARHFAMMMAARGKSSGAMRTATAASKNKVYLQRKDGQLLPITATIGFFDVGEVCYSFVQIQDDTERSQLQDTLIAERDRLGMLLTMGEIGLWTWDAESQRVDVSETWFTMLGYEGSDRDKVRRMIQSLSESGAREFQQFNLLIDWWSKHLHPDDAETARTKIEQFLLMRSTEPYRNLYRCRRQDGTYISIASQGQAVWGDEGSLKSLFIAQVPVTEMAKANQDLREQLTQMASANQALVEQLESAQKQQSVQMDALSKQLAPMLPVLKWGIGALLASTTLLSDKAEDIATGIIQEGGRVVKPVESIVNTEAELPPEIAAQEKAIKGLLGKYKGDADAAIFALYSTDDTGTAYGQILYQATQGGAPLAETNRWAVSEKEATSARYISHKNQLAYEIDAPAQSDRGLSSIGFQYSLPVRVQRWEMSRAGIWRKGDVVEGFVALETEQEPASREEMRQRVRLMQSEIAVLFEHYTPEGS